MSETNWTAFENSNTVTQKWDCLLDIIQNNIDGMCPLKVFKIKQEKKP